MTDATNTPAQRLEQLTSLYERQAYVAWNVALRTALAEDPAADAARRAFLAQVSAPDEARVPFDAARLAAEGATPVDPRGVEDTVLAATARLAPAQRAMLALTALADASGAQVASTLGIDVAAEQELRSRAYEQLGALLGVSAGDVRAAYEDLTWAEPPQELWAALYPELHGSVTRHARTVARVEAKPTPARRRGFPTRRGVPRVALVAVAVLAVAGVAWATTGRDGSGDDGPGGYTPSAGEYGESGGSSFSPDTGTVDAGTTDAPDLTPEELDRLRQEEVEDLKRFVRRKENKKLPRRERRQAARKVSGLVKLAQARQRAAEQRELAIRRQLAREREQRIRERARREQAETRDSDPPPRDRDEPARRDQPARHDPPPSDEPARRDDDEEDGDEARAECLYDPDSGTYICPE
jgi:hypothetical protein